MRVRVSARGQSTRGRGMRTEYILPIAHGLLNCLPRTDRGNRRSNGEWRVSQMAMGGYGMAIGI